MRAGQVAPRRPRGIGYNIQASLMPPLPPSSPLLSGCQFESNIAALGPLCGYVWPCCSKFLQEYLTDNGQRAAVRSLQVVWLTAVSSALRLSLCSAPYDWNLSILQLPVTSWCHTDRLPHKRISQHDCGSKQRTYPHSLPNWFLTLCEVHGWKVSAPLKINF